MLGAGESMNEPDGEQRLEHRHDDVGMDRPMPREIGDHDAQARRDQVFRAACMLADFDSNADPSGVVWHAQHFLREFDDPSHIGVRRAA